jgi:hypothetical protein
MGTGFSGPQPRLNGGKEGLSHLHPRGALKGAIEISG